MALMGDDPYACMHLYYQIARMPGHLADIASNPTSKENILKRPLVQEDECAYARLLDIPAPIHCLEEGLEACYLISSLLQHQLTQVFRHYPLASTNHFRLPFRSDAKQLEPPTLNVS